MTQCTVTIVTAIAEGNARNWLERFLRRLGDRLQRKLPGVVRSGFRMIPQLHFLSWFVVPGEGDGPSLLALEANFDGSRQDFLARLVEQQRPLLDRIYSRCLGYPGRGAVQQSVRQYLENANCTYQLFHVGCPGLSVGEIELEAVLRDRIEQCVRKLGEPHGRRLEYVRRIWGELTPDERDDIRRVPPRPFWVRLGLGERRWWRTLLDFLCSRPLQVLLLIPAALVAAKFAGYRIPDPFDPPAQVLAATAIAAEILVVAVAGAVALWLILLLREFTLRLRWGMRLRIFAAKLWEMAWALLRGAPGMFALLGGIALVVWHAAALVCIVVALISFAVALAVLAAIWLACIARRELDDTVDDMTWDGQALTQLRRREDHGAQNHFVSVTRIKSGRLRWLTLYVVLRAVNLLSRVLYNPRGLSGIASIHFARWLILPGDRRLLFVTNYGGGWGGYLGEFVNAAASGITAIWGNTGGFPRPFLLFGGGCRDEQRFKSYARASQIESLLWYRRYPQLTLSAIKRNAAIREDLARFSRAFGATGIRVPEAELDSFLRRF